MTYQLAIFDFDGTIADSFPFFVAVHDKLAARHGFAKLDYARLDEYRTLEPRAIMRRQGVATWKLPFIAKDFMAMMSAETGGVRLFDGVDEALRLLSAHGVRLAIVTSNSLENVRQAVGDERIRQIEHIEARASLFGKRRRLERVLAATGVAPHEAIYVGDQTTDAEAAHAAGIAFGAVHWGYASADLLERLSPAMSFRTVADLRYIAETRAR